MTKVSTSEHVAQNLFATLAWPSKSTMQEEKNGKNRDFFAIDPHSKKIQIHGKSMRTVLNQ